MKLGVMLEGQEGLTWDIWRQIMARVEELGFESLWRSDHFMSLVDSNRDTLETWVALTLPPRKRRGCGSVPGVPDDLSASILTGAWLRAGHPERWTAGVGCRRRLERQEHRAFGILPPQERMHMLEEGIEVIVRLLGDGPAHFAGRYYQLDGAHPYPKPTQRPRIPLLIGTTSAGACSDRGTLCR